MSDAKTDAPTTSGGGGPSKLPLILVLVNTVAVLVALIFFLYPEFVFKKPKFTEPGERERISQLAAAPAPKATAGMVKFDPMVLNIKSSGNENDPKMHFLKLTFSIELQDMNTAAALDGIKPVILDRLLNMLGRKSFQELITVQGRFVLRTEILDLSNALLIKEVGRKDTLVTNVYFDEFIVQ